MIERKKNRKYKKIVGAIFVSLLVCASQTTFAKRNDKHNFPISQTRNDFPATYQAYINDLKSKHPNWIFKAVYTGLDWNEVIRHESYEVSDTISLVPDSYGAEWKKDGQNYYKDGNFVIASKEAVKYMIDPRNHLTDEELFQFETLNYSAVAHNQTTIDRVLYGTSMHQRSQYKNAGNMIDMGRTYADIILEKAIKYNVSATHIASRIKQETGGDIINNKSINGSVPGYEGVYNFFNIGSSSNSNGQGAVTNGLIYAKSKGWTNPTLAIDAGVNVLQNTWIKWGQNTVYFQKWDVNNEGNAVALYAYQYMQNILAPTNESIMTKRAYANSGLLDLPYEFKIPVFENMPAYAAPYPGQPEQTEPDYVEDNTRIQVDSPTGLNIRSGPGTGYGVITALKNGVQMTRIARSTNSQWDRVRLEDGRVGYAFRDGTKEIDSYVKVESISLDRTEIELLEGTTAKLNATVSPDNAKTKDVTWFSSDDGIASVDGAGTITAKREGNITITARTVDQGKTATCNVRVNYIPVNNISLNITEKTIKRDESLQLVASVMPENAKYKTVNWTSSNQDIATVNENGLVTPKKAGVVTISAITEDQKKVATCKVTIENYIEVSSITLNLEKKQIKIGETVELKAHIMPEDAKYKDVSWESSDHSIATVDQAGKVMAKSSGKAIITAKTKDQEKTATCEILVEYPVTGMTLPKESYRMILGDTLSLTPTVLPDLATNKEYDTSIEDPSIIAYKEGKVVANKVGTTKITFKSKDQGKTITATITVIELGSDNVFIDNSLDYQEKTGYVTKVEPGTKVSELLGKFTSKLKIQAKNKEGTVITDHNTLVGTGTKVIASDDKGTILHEYTIVIYGDVNGDSRISSNDYVLIRNHIMDIKQLTNIQLQGADVNKNGKTSSQDYVLIRNYIMGDHTGITQ